MVEKSRWTKITEENPDHSAWYIQRFKDMAAEGHDLDGEARFIDAMAARESRILDAGCGPGRVGARLADLGHTVVGVDVDPVLIASAKEEHPGSKWVVGDLAQTDMETLGIDEGFDIIVSAGNVMTFLARSTRRAALANLGALLNDDGRLVVGFGTEREYPLSDFYQDVNAVGLQVSLELSTWDILPRTEDSNFIVAVLQTAAA